MPLNKDETRVTLTHDEITFLLDSLGEYRNKPEHKSVWNKLWKAHGRVYRKGYATIAFTAFAALDPEG